MSPQRQGWQSFGVVVCAVALLAAACGGSDDGSGDSGGRLGLDPMPPLRSGDDVGSAPDGSPQQETSGSTPGPVAPEPEAVSGTVTISGSSTVEPISVRVAELFRGLAPGVQVTVDGPGTGDGFKLFCAGETDISDASRRIKDAEAAACADAGIEWIEMRVGIDGIAVLTRLDNDAVNCLNFEDLYALVGPESSGFTNWSEAAALATQLGSATSFPDLDLDITAPGAESGTYDSFIEVVIEDIGEDRADVGAISEDDVATIRPDYVSAGDDNVIISGIEGARGSFGWVGFAYAVDADVKLIDIDGGDGCVAAAPDTIASGEYPVSRSLYVYVNAARAASSDAVTSYLDFFMSDSGLVDAVSDVGYVTLTGAARAASAAGWTGRVVGG